MNAPLTITPSSASLAAEFLAKTCPELRVTDASYDHPCFAKKGLWLIESPKYTDYMGHAELVRFARTKGHRI